MKRIFFILIVTLISSAVGLYFRPSYLLIGQLDWINVISKGHLLGAISKFFSQNFLDESFYFVMRFTAGGLVGGFLLTFMGGKKASKSKKNK
jgi:hypothetical protein